MGSEVEESMKRVVGSQGVMGTIVVNREGVPIKTTLDNNITIQYSGLLTGLTDQAHSCSCSCSCSCSIWPK